MDDALFRIQPLAGYLEGFAKTSVSAYFSPKRCKKYLLDVSCSITPADGTLGQHESSVLPLKLVGEGSIPKLTSGRTEQDLGTCPVGQTIRTEFELINIGPCEIRYTLMSVSSSLGTGEDISGMVKVDLERDGTIHSRTRKQQQVELIFEKPGRYSIHVEAFLRDTGAENGQKRVTLCIMKADVVYPLVQLQRVSVSSMSRNNAWRHYSVDTINAILKSPTKSHNVSFFDFGAKLIG